MLYIIKYQSYVFQLNLGMYQILKYILKNFANFKKASPKNSVGTINPNQSQRGQLLCSYQSKQHQQQQQQQSALKATPTATTTPKRTESNTNSNSNTTKVHCLVVLIVHYQLHYQYHYIDTSNRFIFIEEVAFSTLLKNTVLH